MDSTTFTFQTTIIGRLTIHKDELGDGTVVPATDAARERVKEVIGRIAEPGTGPLVFDEISVGEIVFRDIKESDSA